MTKTLTILEQARSLQSDIVQVRRKIHQHPELSFQETDTARLAAEKLQALGFDVRSGIARTGVVGDLGKGKTVAIRADMDALPIVEADSGAPYISQTKGVMHACGHDAHVACALAAAQLLSEQQLPGRLRMIMQPAEEDVDEELKSGAHRMIEAGVMDGVSAVIGLHIDASIPAGKVGIQAGPVMAAQDSFKIVIRGRGGHGAYPESTIDTVVIAAHVVQTIQQIVSRRISALEPAVVTVGSIHSSSSRGNVISDWTELQGTIRAFNEETRKKLHDELERACSIVNSWGASAEIEYESGYPATVNEPAVTAVMKKVAGELIGAENVVAFPKKTWSEDFSMLAQAAPGAFMFLGAEIEGDRRSHHSPNFDIDESGLYIGAAILAETTRRLMAD